MAFFQATNCYCSYDEDYRGFIFGTSEYISYEETSIYIHIKDFDWLENTMEVQLDINIKVMNKTKDENIYYLLQVPYGISDLEIQYHAQTPSGYNGTYESHYLEEQDISYVLIKIPKSSIILDKIIYIKPTFKLNNVIKSINEYKYTQSFNFDNDFNDALKNESELIKISRNLDRCFYFQLKEATLNIEKSDSYKIDNVEPNPDVVGSWDGKTWYRWNLKNYSSGRFQSAAIVIEFINEELQEQNLFLWERNWLIIGLAASIIPALVINVLWDFITKPKLAIINISNQTDEPKIHGGNNIAFYHLAVINNGLTTALSCDILLKYSDQEREELFALKGKWDQSPEPLGPIEENGIIRLWPSLTAIGGLINIRRKIPETFCIAIKGDEENAYAFNSDSYFYNFRNPSWVLPPGTTYLEVEIRGGNATTKAKFRIENIGETNRSLTIT
jgi:hypothetical protein